MKRLPKSHFSNSTLLAMKNLKISSISPWHNINEHIQYDAFIGAIGYEDRSNYLASKYQQHLSRRIAFAFPEQQVLNYSKNLKWFSENNFEISTPTDVEFEAWAINLWKDIAKNIEGLIHVCLDISSMSRLRIAILVSALFKSGLESSITIDFLYALAMFSPPPISDGPIIVAKPVTDWFAGWSDQPEIPTSVIFGLGYEEEKAVGVTEYLEPAEVWAFIPTGHDPRYDRAIKRANTSLWDILPKDHIVKYLVDQPFQCFADLESLVFGTLRSARPVLVPFGPKMFTLCCLLVAALHYPEVSVWRVSSGRFATPLDRVNNGNVVGLTATFDPSD